MVDTRDMNSWQEVVYDLCYGAQLVSPKRIAFILHKHSDYLSDICRRERVDPFAVCNAILTEAEQFAATDTGRYLRICQPVLALLLDRTRWMAIYMDPALATGLKYTQLCEQTGTLCEALGGAIKALARIEMDGEVDANDDADIAACEHKMGLLIQRLNALMTELHRRRAASVKETPAP